MPTLTVLKGVEPGRVYRLPVRPSIVGRQDNCEVALDDPRASRQHACFRLHGDHWQVKDLDTENGTFVDGTKISGWTILRNGAKLRVGHTLMRFDDDPVAMTGAAGAVAAEPVSPLPPATPVPQTSPRPAAAPPLRDTPPPLRPLDPASARQSRPAQDPRRAFPEIPGCELDRIVGRGATGTVYHGRQVTLGREVAVKVLDPALATQPQQVTRFVQEAKSAAVLSHPNVVPVIDVGEHRGVHYFLMEFMRGGTLQDRLDAAGGAGLPWREAVRIASAAALGLGYIHKKGLVHRDVKPANVLLGESGEVKLGDLGTMVRVDDGATERIGTPNFMSPEQAMRRPVTRASDVYSLGATLYYALSGLRPHTGRDVREVVASVAANAPAPLDVVRPGLPREVVAVVTGMMARDESMRPTDATKVAERLAAALDEVQAVREERRRGQRTRRELSGWVTSLVVLAGIGVVLWLMRDQVGQVFRDISGEAPPPGEVSAGVAADPAAQPAAGSAPVSAEAAGNPSNATEYLVALRQREALLGALTAANAGQYRDIAADYARVAARFPTDDPSVPIARDRSRELVALVAATTGGDPVYRGAAEAWTTRAIAAATPDRDAFVAPLDLATLRQQLDSLLATETKRLRSGQPRVALEVVASWVATTTAAAERHRQKSVVVTDAAAAAKTWLTQSALEVMTKLHADLGFDVALFRAQSASLAGIVSPRGGRPDDIGAAFAAAIAQGTRMSRLAMTWTGRNRIDRRTEVLTAQQRAWASVEGLSRPPVDAVAPGVWRDAVAQSVQRAWPNLPAEHRWGAVALLVEVGKIDEAEDLIAAEPALGTANGRYLRTEIAARREYARADGGADPAWRLAALRSWVRDHAASDASLLLARQAKGLDLMAEHGVFGIRERDRFVERFGEEPTASEPAPPK